MIELNFLFWLFFSGILIATFQDLKRREVDNWLNLLLLLVSLSYVFFNAFMNNNPSIIILAGFIIIIMFAVMNLFYYGRVFGGGDAGLLFAMTAFFIGSDFTESILNLGVFLLFLMISGSVYGILYSLILYIKNREKANKEFRKHFRKSKNFLLLFLVLGILIFFLTSSIFLKVFSIFIIFLPLVFLFAKSLENISMVKFVQGSKLRPGDWLAEEVKVGNKKIGYCWDGLTKEEVRLLSKKRKVKIKEGLPFVPAFLIAFLLYAFLRNLF